MKKVIYFIVFVILITPAFSKWELRYNADNIHNFASDGKAMYLGRVNGLTAYDLTTHQSANYTSFNSDMPGNYINTLLLMPDSTILISTNGGLALIENGVITQNKAICKDYPDDDARDLYRDTAGNIWTFSSHKIHKYSNGVWTTFDLSIYINYKFDLAKLYFHKNNVWAFFNDNTLNPSFYYFPNINNYNFKIAVIADTGLVRLFQTTKEFPYQQGKVSMASANDDVYLMNINGVYIYHDTIWEKTVIFNFYNNVPVTPDWYQGFITDKKGNIWFIEYSETLNISYPACYDVSTGQTTEYLNNIDEKSIPHLTILDDGTIVAYSSKNFYFKNDTSWVQVALKDTGIPDGISFYPPKLVNGKKYVIINSHIGNLVPGTLLCLDDKTIIPPINTGFPFNTISQLGIKKDGKGIYKGIISFNEQLQYEADSAFVPIKLVSDLSTVKPCKDGYVYFINHWDTDTAKTTPYLTTWDGNKLIKKDMGYMDKLNSKLNDFDIFNNNLIALGEYPYSQDSIISYVSILNTINGNIIKYDNSNSCLPVYHYNYSPGDTNPHYIASDNNMNIWIFTDKSLIKLNPGNNKIYEIPKRDSSYYIIPDKICFDSITNELVCTNEKVYATIINQEFYIFDIANEKWDSVKFADAGLIGNYITHKKLLDNRVWACDDKGYLYNYVGKGKFKPYELKISGKENLGFAINDFSIDANNYLYLGTDFGLLTNKEILTGVGYEPTVKENLIVMPNPTGDFITILLPNGMEVSKNLNIQIYSVFGIKVIETKNQNRIDVSGLAAGVYFVKVGGKVTKFVKM